jgi:hypothetical protein
MLDLLYDSFRCRPHSWECLVDGGQLLQDAKLDSDLDSPLYHNQDDDLLDLYHLILTLPPREALLALHSRIVSFVKEHLSSDAALDSILERNSIEEQLDALVALLVDQPDLLFHYESKMANYFALVKAYSNNLSTRQELQSAEKVITALLAQTRESSSIFYQLHDMLKKITLYKQEGKSSTLATRDILLLTLHMYALIGDSLGMEEQHQVYLQKAFVQAMLTVRGSL